MLNHENINKEIGLDTIKDLEILVSIIESFTSY